MGGTEDWSVWDLIDAETLTWCEETIHALFTESEAEIILKIPLSLRQPDDKLIWHYDSRGLFSVRSCYNVSRSSPRTGKCEASASAGNGMTCYWKFIWKVNIPPKVRSFVWRLVKGFLPTRVNLNKKHVSLPSLKCVFCDNAQEDDLHLFKDCKVVAALWLVCPLKMSSSSYQVPSFQEWFMVLMDDFSIPQREKWFLLLWAVWKARNDVVWNDRAFDVWWTVSWSMQYLADYQKVNQVATTRKGRRPRVKWKFPPTGRLKINVDGSFYANTGCGGLGVVARTDRGQCLAALAKHVAHATSALHMEAMALRACILLAIHEQWKDVEIECDCAVLTAAFTRTDEDFSEIGCIVEDCKAYLESIDSVQVQLIHREANCVANMLAKLASASSIDYLWLDETPAIIQDVLYEDIVSAFNVSRSSGIMSPPWSSVS